MMSLSALVAARDSGKATPELMVALCRDAIAARESATGAFSALAENPVVSTQGPLAGIAIGVKDIFDTFDLPTAYGSKAYAGHQPKTDAALVALARRRGATIIGKTETTEFAFFEPCRTVNPHNPAHTPGGSSSGSAAAVAAGMLPAALGTQTGGSVVRPASFCGVAGYKPGYRLLPASGMKHFSPLLDTAGLFAAGVADVALFAELLTGRPLAGSASEAEDLPIGLYRCSQLASADADMRAAVEAVAAMAANAGHPVIEIEEPEILARAREAHVIIQNYEAGLTVGPDLERFRPLLSDRLIETVESGLAIAPETYDEARRTAKRARLASRDVFDAAPVLLTPSAPGTAPLGLGSTGDPRFNKLWTLLGVPALSVPGMKGDNGLPLGVQIVTRFGADRLLLSAGTRLENLIAGRWPNDRPDRAWES